ncbi:MAG: hypothetical protein WCO67_00785 [Betaproteobacteria bacterium]
MSRLYTGIFLAFACLATLSEAASVTVRPVETFDRHALTDPAAAARVRDSRSLSAGGWGVTGWVEYDVLVGEPGWHELLVHGSGTGVEFLVDADAGGQAQAEHAFYGGSGQGRATDKIGNLWLTTGKHRVRIQRYYWTGFPALTAFELRKSGEALSESIALVLPNDQRTFRKGECPALEVITGGRNHADRLVIHESDPQANKKVRTHEMRIPPSPGLLRQRFELPCSESGFRTLWFADNNGLMPNEKVRGLTYEIVDTTPLAAATSTQAHAPVLEIDCARQAPDFSGGGTSTVVARPFGRYRESGDTGWTRYVRTPEVMQRALPPPSWFAYALSGLVPQQRYRIEVDYPDDALRTFAIAMRESAPLSYPVATGVDSGGEYLLSNAMQSTAITVWPRAPDPRLVFLTAHNGSRAACSRIRVYRATAPEPPPATAGIPGRRQFLNWFEEGSNFPSMFGPVDESAFGQRVAAERWAEAVTAVGGSVVMPTVVVYGFALYPSRYNRAFSAPDQDMLRRLLLVAEKYRLKVIPELHPRADELAYARPDAKLAPTNVLVSREGKSNFFQGDGKSRSLPPYFNALLPENQAWYIGMVGELADRYRDSPAFEGISLRVMHWANPALNNLVDLDWGYDDYTVALFKRETGSAVPLGTPGDPRRFGARYTWLTTVERAAWVEWRCRKLAELLTRIRDRVRQARPDLNVYVNTFTFGRDENLLPGFSSTPGDTLTSRLRETGIDASMLNAIDGIVLINASVRHGRREFDGIHRGFRDTLLDPSSLGVLRKPGQGGRFLASAQYLEATEVVVPPESLGFPASTKKTWMSAVSNPAGRHALERYAVALAETDAFTLGDGGNGYTFGPPLVREFMAEFRRLPAESFASRTDATDPVVVRTLETKASLLFYAVNRERFPVTLQILLSRPSKLVRLATDEQLALSGNRLTLNLQPYELVTVRADPDVRISRVSTEAPVEHRSRVERQIEWIGRLSKSGGIAALVRRGPNAQERALLAEAGTAAREAFDRGALWRARTLIEHSSLLAIYRRLACYPPDLFSGESHASGCAD